ncbi:MAG: D-aminoacyl-tRNA deacylase [Desulfonatronovibrionaceae bacterium]
MRLILQRVKWARVSAQAEEPAEIGPGLLVLAGFAAGDEQLKNSREWTIMLDKLLGLRIFSDARGKMNLSLKDIQGWILLVPQFTLYADCCRGRRPGFSASAPYDTGQRLFDLFHADLKQRWNQVKTGFFGADMDVELNNQGPVTIILDSDHFSKNV